MKRFLGILLIGLMPGPVLADPVSDLSVSARQTGAGIWRFDVTLAHPDTGWDHYADGWEVLDAAGQVLGSRPLAHPHVNEQPFTRSVGGVAIPANVIEVFIRTTCNVDGAHDRLWAYTLPR